MVATEKRILPVTVTVTEKTCLVGTYVIGATLQFQGPCRLFHHVLTTSCVLAFPLFSRDFNSTNRDHNV